MVRDLEFDVAEMAIMTFLLAKAHGKPLRLLPAVLHGALPASRTSSTTPNAVRLRPRQLNGKRVGMRSYSVTTATWIRGILAEDYGVDLAQRRLGHVRGAARRGVPRPAERASARPAGKDITAMLLAGELDAAIVGEIPQDPRIKPLIPDPEAAGAGLAREARRDPAQPHGGGEEHGR